jgi:hypothetical protein
LAVLHRQQQCARPDPARPGVLSRSKLGGERGDVLGDGRCLVFLQEVLAGTV